MAFEVAPPSTSDAEAEAIVEATVCPRAPSWRMDGPVSRVPNIDATPANAANRPHWAAPHPRSSRARTCHRSPIPLVSDCDGEQTGAVS